MRASITTLVKGGGNGDLTVQTTGNRTKHLHSQKVSHLRIPQYMAGNAQLVVALVVNRHTLNSLAVMYLLINSKEIGIVDLNILRFIVERHIAMGVVTLIIYCLTVLVKPVLR